MFTFILKALKLLISHIVLTPRLHLLVSVDIRIFRSWTVSGYWISVKKNVNIEHHWLWCILKDDTRFVAAFGNCSDGRFEGRIRGLPGGSRGQIQAYISRKPSPVAERRRWGEESTAAQPPPQAWNVLESEWSPVKISVCTESHRTTCFLQSTRQQLYHYPKNENVLANVGGARLWKKERVIMTGVLEKLHLHLLADCALLYSPNTSSICLFRWGVFFLPSFLIFFFFFSKKVKTSKPVWGKWFSGTNK